MRPSVIEGTQKCSRVGKGEPRKNRVPSKTATHIVAVKLEYFHPYCDTLPTLRTVRHLSIEVTRPRQARPEMFHASDRPRPGFLCAAAASRAD